MGDRKVTKSKNNNEEILREWLITMGANRNILQDNVLTPACLGTLHQLWRSITQQVKPAKQCKTIRENIFVDSVNKHSSGRHSHSVQLTLYSRKIDLESQKESLLHQKKQQKKLLDSALNNVTTNKTKLEKAKQDLINIRRKRVLLDEFKKQLKTDIEHSDNAANVLSTFVNTQNADNKNLPCLENLPKDDPIEVDKLLAETDIPTFWDSVLSQRQNSVDLLMKMATTTNLQSELSVVEKNTLETFKAKSWKDGIVDLNSIYLQIVFSVLKCDKEISELSKRGQDLLKFKLNHSRITEDQKNLFKLHLKVNSMKRAIISQKTFVEGLEHDNDIFSADPFPDESNMSLDISEVRQEITSIHKSSETLEEEIKSDMSKIVEAVPRMKDYRNRVLETLGRDTVFISSHSNKLANLFESILSANTSKQSDNLSLIEIRDKMAELKILDCIDKQYKRLIDEVKSLIDYNLELNKKLILSDGSEVNFSETDAGRQIPEDDEVNNLIDSWKNASCVIKKYLNRQKWDSSLAELSDQLEKYKKREEEKSVDMNTSVAEDETSSDFIKKRAKAAMKILKDVQHSCGQFDEKVKFFSDVKWKNYVSKNRKVNDRSFLDYESEIEQMIREIS